MKESCAKICSCKTVYACGLPVQDALVLQPRRRHPLSLAVVGHQPHFRDAYSGGLGYGHFAFLLGLPMLHSTAAFQAVTSISTIGLYISCKPRSTPHLSVDLGCLGLLPGMPCILVFIPQEFIAAVQYGIALCKPSSNRPKALGSTPQWRTHDPYLSCLVKLQASHLQGRTGFIREGEWGTW